MNSSIVTIRVGPEHRLFAAHENILCLAPFFAACCHDQASGESESRNKRIDLPEEQPEVLSSVLEYLYRGDYYPKLVRNDYGDSWDLEDIRVDRDGQSREATVFHRSAGVVILKDTAI